MYVGGVAGSTDEPRVERELGRALWGCRGVVNTSFADTGMRARVRRKPTRGSSLSPSGASAMISLLAAVMVSLLAALVLSLIAAVAKRVDAEEPDADPLVTGSTDELREPCRALKGVAKTMSFAEGVRARARMIPRRLDASSLFSRAGSTASKPDSK